MDYVHYIEDLLLKILFKGRILDEYKEIIAQKRDRNKLNKEEIKLFYRKLYKWKYYRLSSRSISNGNIY